ncbi:MAG: zf-TFIIB domain-containing protein [Lysobacteraceae bacterium]
MQCPKCHAPMHPVSDTEETVQRCTACNGLWFEIMAHEQLREEAERIDPVAPSPPAADEAFDPTAPATRVILCPACGHYPLIHMVDPHQPHIRFESCKFCYGRFYDAGEFRDFADAGEYETAIDRLLKRIAPSADGATEA